MVQLQLRKGRRLPQELIVIKKAQILEVLAVLVFQPHNHQHLYFLLTHQVVLPATPPSMPLPNCHIFSHASNSTQKICTDLDAIVWIFAAISVLNYRQERRILFIRSHYYHQTLLQQDPLPSLIVRPKRLVLLTLERQQVRLRHPR